MELVVDIGNTNIKTGVFENGTLKEKQVFPVLKSDDYISYLGNYSQVPSIIASVNLSLHTERVRQILLRAHLLTHQSKVPFINKYTTPRQLGADRVAVMAAAISLKPQKDVLVLDAGTCITYDLMTAAGEYLGGAISPGLNMRYKALHTAAQLPQLQYDTDFTELAGADTNGSIHAGVQSGMLAEVEGMVGRYREKYPHLLVLACGGDSSFLVKRTKCNIFAEPDLVLIGLYHILKINAQ